MKRGARRHVPGSAPRGFQRARVIVTMAENNLACFANTASDDDSMEGGEHTEKREWEKRRRGREGPKRRPGFGDP